MHLDWFYRGLGVKSEANSVRVGLACSVGVSREVYYPFVLLPVLFMGDPLYIYTMANYSFVLIFVNIAVTRSVEGAGMVPRADCPNPVAPIEELKSA